MNNTVLMFTIWDLLDNKNFSSLNELEIYVDTFASGNSILVRTPFEFYVLLLGCEKERRMSRFNEENYCKDCDRSVYGKYHDCDINIENNGRYVRGEHPCYCKIVNGERAERYPWEMREGR